jgi:hypothetical protein
VISVSARQRGAALLPFKLAYELRPVALFLLQSFVNKAITPPQCATVCMHLTLTLTRKTIMCGIGSQKENP